MDFVELELKLADPCLLGALELEAKLLSVVARRQRQNVLFALGGRRMWCSLASVGPGRGRDQARGLACGRGLLVGDVTKPASR